jgi:hypothetical protein
VLQIVTGVITGKGRPMPERSFAPLSKLLTIVAVSVGFTYDLSANAVPPSDAGARLVAAYPEHLDRVEGNEVVWRDGTRMTVDDGKGVKTFEALVDAPDLDDIFAIAYAPGDTVRPPAINEDPGRARPAAFYDKMYGDCRTGGVTPNLVEVVWLPKKAGTKLKVTKVNGVAEKLAAVSSELDALPASFDTYLKPAGGTYNCRVIAGTKRISTHGHGIAIDISLKHASYWRWNKSAADGRYPYKNNIPMEIVRIFEQHGFIWGGKWYHYDTMHFEYRPELLVK